MAVHLALVACHNLVDALAGHCRVDGEQVGDAGLSLAVVGDDGAVIGHGGLNLLLGDLGGVQKLNQALIGCRRLGHLRGRVLQVVNLSGFLQNHRIGHHEGLTETGIETLRQVTGQLQVLTLILAHGHAVHLVEQDVGSHQNRVGEQAHGGVLGALLLGFVLELGHTGRLAKAGEAVQNPRQLGVLGHVRLHEQRGAGRVNAGGDVLRRGQAGTLTQLLGVLRNGDGVHIWDKEQAFVIRVVLQRDPVVHSTNIVTQVHRISRRLRTRVDTRLLLRGVRDEGLILLLFVCHSYFLCSSSCAVLRTVQHIFKNLSVGGSASYSPMR